jgi:hypothetical protein
MLNAYHRSEIISGIWEKRKIEMKKQKKNSQNEGT